MTVYPRQPVSRFGRYAGIFVITVLLAGGAARAGEIKEYQTRYYVIYTDHDAAMVKEATARVTAMAEEYYERTKDFTGKIRKRLPFYMYSSEADYKAAGGIGAGYFTGDRLMAYVPKGGGFGWHVVQHEGFHQFVHAVIGGRIPVWVDEGLAEYFGEGVWTGDSFVTGCIPGARLRRIRALIQSGKLLPFPDMFNISSQQWKTDLNISNYDQAWSMVHFLVHGDDGKYQKPFTAFLIDCSKGQPPAKAFIAHFGNDLKGFEDKYRAWWTGLPDAPTADRFTLAVCHIFESFLARANTAGQKFKDIGEFFAAARAGKLQSKPDDWLPLSLLQSALASPYVRQKTWSLDNAGARPRIVFSRDDGVIFTAEYTQDAKDYKTKVEIKKAAAPDHVAK